jgi:hypothetical protein
MLIGTYDISNEINIFDLLKFAETGTYFSGNDLGCSLSAEF